MRETIGRYRILSQLGAGGMGEVFLAEDTRLRRRVAIKLIDPASSTDALRKKRLLREAQAASRLSHPNIGVVYDSGESDDGLSYIAMEYIEGETLFDVLSRGPLTAARAIDLGSQIADALAEAHRNDIVHRDLKPSNVIITPSGRAKVVDFGLATMNSELEGPSDDHSTEVLTREGVILGTLLYMSPEQARGEKVDGRSDIFSFGSVLYEMVTGRRPFQGANLVSAIHAIAHEHPQPFPRSGDLLLPAVERVVSRCLEKSKADRYQKAEEVAADLRSLTVSPGPEARRRRYGLLLAVALTLAVLGVWIGSRAGKERRQNPPLSSPPPVSAAQPATARVRALGVLPFVNTSGDVETGHFSDGMTEEIINSLTNVRGLRVASRSSVFALKGKSLDVREVGRSLRVDSVVEGSVRKAGNRIRVVAQLTDATNGYQLWSESFDRELTDVFEIQEQIATAIASRLSAGEPVMGSAVKTAPTRNLEAYRYFLAGRSLARQSAIDTLRSAIRNYERAVQIDPAFALAYAEMADAHRLLVARAGSTPEEGFAKAMSAAHQAVALDPGSAAAHATLAEIFARQGNWNAAEAELKQTIKASPNSGDAYRSYSRLLNSMGRAEEAIALARKAYALDPAHASSVGRALYSAASYGEALPWFDRALTNAPQSAVLRYYRAMTLAGLRRYEEAGAEMERAIELSGDQRWRIHLAHIHAMAGARAEATRLMNDVLRKSSPEMRPRLEAATVHAVLGEKEQALVYLEEAYRERPSDLVDVKTEPDLVSLHGHPRFEALLAKMKLPASKRRP